jgi:hypothetical protein
MKMQIADNESVRWKKWLKIGFCKEKRTEFAYSCSAYTVKKLLARAN